MDILRAALAPEVADILFLPPSPGEAVISQVVQVSDTLDLISITFDYELSFVIAFATVIDQANGDDDFLRQMAEAWTVFCANEQVVPDARIVKFFRRDADSDDMFDPAKYPLPRPFTIWQLQDALTLALVSYTQERPGVQQFFFFPQSEALDCWYGRLSRKFCSPMGALNSGIVFRQIARPEKDTGGFYGYERA